MKVLFMKTVHFSGYITIRGVTGLSPPSSSSPSAPFKQHTLHNLLHLTLSSHLISSQPILAISSVSVSFPPTVASSSLLSAFALLPSPPYVLTFSSSTTPLSISLILLVWTFVHQVGSPVTKPFSTSSSVLTLVSGNGKNTPALETRPHIMAIRLRLSPVFVVGTSITIFTNEVWCIALQPRVIVSIMCFAIKRPRRGTPT
jgi:hypothetical protein